MTREEAINSLRDKIIEIRAYCDESKHMSEVDRQDMETFDIAIKALEQEPRKGHWIEEFNDLEGEVRFTCSSCGKYQLFGTDFCYHCGSDNREVVEK